MNILLTNDDGFDAPGLHAAFRALRELGTVHIVAPSEERSACSHTLTLRGPITVRRIECGEFGEIHVVAGTPADCVRLATARLVEEPVDLIVAGINRGANLGVDTFYSGTVAAAREGAIQRIPAIALSQAVRNDVDEDWRTASKAARLLVARLMEEELPGPGFWSVNFPAPTPEDFADRIHRVPLAVELMPVDFEYAQRDGLLIFDYAKTYWHRDVTPNTDYGIIRDGGISVTAIPLTGRF